MIPIHRGKVINGKKIYDNPSRFLVQLSALEGKRFEETLKQEKSQRSNQQNAYLWGVVYEILSDHTGYTADEIHEIMKFKFLRTHKPVGQNDMEFVKSTTKLNTAEMEGYLEKIRMWASRDLGCFIPLPNEVEYAP